jgi:hypothetical protein
MTRLRIVLLCFLFLTVAPSCARTVYTNLHPQLPAPTVAIEADRSSPQHWRSFFVFGWGPRELVIDAAAYCNGADRVERIETQQTFAQGLVAVFASYYINIYSPYTGRVVCDSYARAHR